MKYVYVLGKYFFCLVVAFRVRVFVLDKRSLVSWWFIYRSLNEGERETGGGTLFVYEKSD